MNTAQKRQRIHEYVDQADDRLLTIINGIIDADQGHDWWDDLNPDLKASIDRALDQSQKGEGRSHEEVMLELRAKYEK